MTKYLLMLKCAELNIIITRRRTAGLLGLQGFMTGTLIPTGA